MTARTPEKITLGWREWVSLPELGVTGIMAKVDTGARTSALHTITLETEMREHGEWVRFVLPAAHASEALIDIEWEIKERRIIRDSGGHETERPIIETSVRIGQINVPRKIDIALSQRHGMSFPMLLGRTALRPRFAVDPARSFLAGSIAS